MIKWCVFFMAVLIGLPATCKNSGQTDQLGGGPGRAPTLAQRPPYTPPTPAGRYFYAAPDGTPKGDGKLGAPSDLATALSRVTPGATIFLRGGTYLTGAAFGTEADTWNCSRSGAPDAAISLLAYPGESPVIRGHFRVTGSHLRIAGITFEGGLSRDPASPTERREVQVWLKDCHDVVFEANEVRYNDYHAGIFLSRVYNVQILRCYVHDNGRFGLKVDPRTGSATSNVDHGIYWGSSAGGGNLIANCLFERNRGYGVHLYPRAFGVEVLHNTMVGNGNSGLIVAGSSDRITVANNISAFNERNPQLRILSGPGNLVSHNLTWSPTSGLADIENATASVLTGNFVAEPAFVNRAAGNYRLRVGSPAVDSGNRARGVPKDYETAPRPRGNGYDCGAFEQAR